MSESNQIQTIDPEIEPEYVGAHSALTDTRCQHWHGETTDDIEACGADATHTVVMFSGGKLHEVASCDDCGEPEDVTNHDRRWTGELVSDDDRNWPEAGDGDE